MRLGNLTVIFIVGVVLAIGLLIGSSFLPADRVNAHIGAEAAALRDEPMEERWLGSVYQRHNFSEALAMNQAMIDPTFPVQSTLVPSHYAVGEGQDALGDLVERAETGAAANAGYPRYWTGHIVWNRILFFFTDMSGARLVNAALLGLLFLTLLTNLWRWVSPGVAIVTLAVTLPLAWNVMGFAIFFPPVFLVTLLAALYALAFSLGAPAREWDVELFMVAGMATTYFDSFSVPLFTLAVPLIVALAFRSIRASYDVEGPPSPLEGLRTVVRGSVAWVVGYGGLWAAKWVLNEIWAAPGTLSDTVAQIGLRAGAGGGVEVDLAYRLQAVLGNLYYYVPNMPMPGEDIVGGFLGVALVLLVLAAVWGLGVWLVGARRNAIAVGWPLLLVALMPVVWIFLVAEHSYTHFTSVYRLTAIAVLSLLTFAVVTVDWGAARNRFAGGVRQSDGEG